MADTGGISDYAILNQTKHENPGSGSAGWASLGAALGGGTEVQGANAYDRGMQIGASTIDALAQARARVTANDANQRAAAIIRNPQVQSQLGYTPEIGDYAATVAERGGDPREVAGMLKENQDRRFQSTLGDALAPQNQREAAQAAIAPGSVAPKAEGPLGSVFRPLAQTPQGAGSTTVSPLQAQVANSEIGQHNASAASSNATAAGKSNTALDPNAIDYGSYMLYKTGKLPSLGMGSGQARMAMIAGAQRLSAQEAQGQDISNPGYDKAISQGQDFTAAGRSLGSFAGGPLGNQTRSINNVVGHLSLMENLFTGLKNGDTQVVNKLGNEWTKQFGGPAPTNVQTAASFIGPELVKILSNSGTTGTEEERQEFSKTAASLANAPEQTAGAISTLKNMLGRQATDLAVQYHGATGRSDFASRYINPDAAKYLELSPNAEPAKGGKPPAAGGHPQDIQTLLDKYGGK
ncbi:MAG: hypothetical protein ACHP7J_06115 [Terriglobales bacterium]